MFENKRRQEDWDRKSFERSMDTIRDLQRDPNEGYASTGGSPYQGGVFSSATYGSGAEYYSITGMYENPLLQKERGSMRGKAPRNYSRSDERIFEEVCEQLTSHPLIDASSMDVVVLDGEVTLTGEVYDRRMKHLTEDVVDGIAGVKEIHNKLRVSRNRAA
jgi:osmotically-inducible protein OsmY